MRSSNPLRRLLHTRLVSPYNDFLTARAATHCEIALPSRRPTEPHSAHSMSRYERSLRNAFLTYPTIPRTGQQGPTHRALNLAREWVEARPSADVPTLPLRLPHGNSAHTQKIIRVWRRANGGRPQEIVTFPGEDRYGRDLFLLDQAGISQPTEVTIGTT